MVAAAATPRVEEEVEWDLHPALASPARWITNAEYSGSRYRWSLSRGALDFGLGFDTSSSPHVAARETRLDATGPYVSTLPAVSVVLRTVANPAPTAGSLLERAASTGAASSGTRSVGIEWKPAQSQLLFLRQGLGIRLSGDDRLTMRLRNGTLGIYMRRDF